MKRLIIIGIGIVLPFLAAAQVDPNAYGYYIDALNFSTSMPTGSARIMGIGGSNVALGADISSAYSNPAGLGLFNRSVISLTPAVTGTNFSTDFLGEVNDNRESTFNIYNGGFVFNNMKEDPEGPFLGGSFGISVSRVDDFNGTFYYNGINNNNSIIDSWIEQSNGATTEQFFGNDFKSLAYFNYLLGPETVFDPNGSPTTYFTDIIGIPEQEESVQTSGSQYQWSIGYGANFSDRFYLGASLGLTSLTYRQDKVYREYYVDEPIFDLTLTETLRIRSNGINASVGMIVRPIDQLRIGASVTTPTAYSVDDEYNGTLTAEWNNYVYGDLIFGDTLLNGPLVSETDIFLSSYRATAPTRFNTGAAFFLGKIGFITADVEFVNHGRTRLRADNFSMEADNNSIEAIYRNAINMRFGAEFRIKPLMLRGGYALYGNPYADPNIGSDVSTFTAGAGFRVKAFFLDLAYVNSSSSNTYTPYILNNGNNPVADVSKNRNSVLMTLGLNF